MVSHFFILHSNSTFHLVLINPTNYPVGIYLLKVNNANDKIRCEICSRLTIKAPERRHWCCSDVFIVNFEHVIAGWVKTKINYAMAPFHRVSVGIVSCWSCSNNFVHIMMQKKWHQTSMNFEVCVFSISITIGIQVETRWNIFFMSPLALQKYLELPYLQCYKTLFHCLSHFPAISLLHMENSPSSLWSPFGIEWTRIASEMTWFF